MDSQSPIPNETTSQGRALRVAILVLAMSGYMFLWSNMDGGLPVPEVTLASGSRINPNEARDACFTIWRRTIIRYQPMVAQARLGLFLIQEKSAEFHQAILKKIETRRRVSSISISLIRSAFQTDYSRIRSQAFSFQSRVELQLRESAVRSLRNLMEESQIGRGHFRLDLLRISLEPEPDRSKN